MNPPAPPLTFLGIPVEVREWMPPDAVMLVSQPNPDYPVEAGYDPLDPRRWEGRVAVVSNIGTEQRLGGR